MSKKMLKIAFVVGEESGDALAADLLSALRLRHDSEVTAIGVGGAQLQALGLVTMFDPHEIALFGLSSVISKLPRLVSLIRSTAVKIIAEDPDCLIIVDSPDFTHRVAKRVRAAQPDVPILNYVCPSVWAWRQGRAKKMRAYVDEVLAILPFEPDYLNELGGPPATYVGHRLSSDPFILAACEGQSRMELDRFSDWKKPIRLLCLPGSRRGEIERHMGVMGETLGDLRQRGRQVRALLQTPPKHESLVRKLARDWAFHPEISTDMEGKAAAFTIADVALAASGTVTLELALAGVPAVSIYKLDPFMRMFRRHIKIWTASLPGLIADQPIIPEYFDEMIRPGKVARELEKLARPGPSRDAQLQGFELVRERLQTDRKSGETAAARVLSLIEKRSSCQPVGRHS
jgi:lipid-A-disaccharide synthase